MQPSRDILLFAATILSNTQSRFVCVSSTNPTESGIIAFTGTQTPRDLILDDLDVRSVRWPTQKGFFVHRGFARRTRQMLEEMQPFLNDHDSFVLTGHSLGGACAILAASALVESGKCVQSVYTFGTPRLASVEFGRLYHVQGLGDKTFNFATTQDPIVHRLPELFNEVCPYLSLDCDEDDVWAHHDMQMYLRVIKSLQ